MEGSGVAVPNANLKPELLAHGEQVRAVLKMF